MEHRKNKLQLKAANQDECIIATNNSSIVSKRSVERLYYPDEPHFFRYFVKKPQRRAPLINRGYWLRMKAIESVIHDFLTESSDIPKVVINLGCGYDPNPWQCFARFPEACKDVIFIDVDYMALMVKKCCIVRETVELNSRLTNLSFPHTGEILLQSDQYIQVGCDLRDLSKFSAILASVINLHKHQVLFTAEVSITYMEVEAADDLIRWAVAFPHTRFCLLEQILPDGANHPFAQTMLAHFGKLQTNLQAIGRYPTIHDQKERFKKTGWLNVQAKNLWELWSSPEFLTSDQRCALEMIEPFDEWEEFALFGSHYFLLVAGSIGYNIPYMDSQPFGELETSLDADSARKWIAYIQNENSCGCRRFAAPLLIRSSNRQRDIVGNFAGMGWNTRVNSCDAYTNASFPEKPFYDKLPLLGPSARMCHTITDLGDAGALLVGGRTSPDHGLADCWLYYKWINMWERVDDIPIARYRHAAMRIANDVVLVAGGKSSSLSILKGFLVWSRRHGWLKCAPTTDEEPATFGGALVPVNVHNSNDSGTIRGIWTGGISQDGTVSKAVWFWTLYGCGSHEPSVTFIRIEGRASIARFGSTTINCAGHLLLLGGIIPDRIVTKDEEVLTIRVSQDTSNAIRIVTQRIPTSSSGPRPLLIGSSIYCIDENVLIMGGGAVCFSFGTFWNRRCFSLRVKNTSEADKGKPLCNNQNEARPMIDLHTWTFLQTMETVSLGDSAKNLGGKKPIPNIKQMAQTTTVPYIRLKSADEFSTIVAVAKPVIIQGLGIGNCTTMWSQDYLKSKIGSDRMVVVHQSSESHMDFIAKNFQYIKKPFGEFMECIARGEKLYLRSLSAEKPSDIPADLVRDFPAIAADFQLPSELKMVVNNAHSSPLRISGPVNMWLHYDVMANILCQIQGSRRLLLFPPSDIRAFGFSPGSSSSSVDVFKMLDNADLANVHPYEVILKSGDVLFLPAFWLHAASSMEGISIAVNVFFRNLEGVYAAGRDIYGNRDLQAYEQARRDVARIAKSFNSLPNDVRNFYLQRLAGELEESVLGGTNDADLA